MREPAFIRVSFFVCVCVVVFTGIYYCYYYFFLTPFHSGPQAEKLLFALHRGQSCCVTHNLLVE